MVLPKYMKLVIRVIPLVSKISPLRGLKVSSEFLIFGKFWQFKKKVCMALAAFFDTSELEFIIFKHVKPIVNILPVLTFELEIPRIIIENIWYITHIDADFFPKVLRNRATECNSVWVNQSLLPNGSNIFYQKFHITLGIWRRILAKMGVKNERLHTTFIRKSIIWTNACQIIFVNIYDNRRQHFPEDCWYKYVFCKV